MLHQHPGAFEPRTSDATQENPTAYHGLEINILINAWAPVGSAGGSTFLAAQTGDTILTTKTLCLNSRR